MRCLSKILGGLMASRWLAFCCIVTASICALLVMWYPDKATIFGLCLDIIGVFILFFNGPPLSLILPNGAELVSNSDYGSAEEKRNKKIAERKNRCAQFALFIILAGFSLQLIDQLTNKEYHRPDIAGNTNTCNIEINTAETKPSPIKAGSRDVTPPTTPSDAHRR